MKAKEIRDLIDFIAKSGLEEVNIETDEFKISIKRNAAQIVQAVEKLPAALPPANVAPVINDRPSNPVATPPETREEAPEASNKHVEIKSPMIGTFYRSPNPDADNFVNIGDRVEVGQTVCIVEAMKLFNEIESDVAGTIVKVLIDNSMPVEYDQPLFLIDPA